MAYHIGFSFEGFYEAKLDLSVGIRGRDICTIRDYFVYYSDLSFVIIFNFKSSVMLLFLSTTCWVVVAIRLVF